MATAPKAAAALEYVADLTRYRDAVSSRLLDRAKPNVNWPEIAVIGADNLRTFSLASALRAEGIAAVVVSDARKAMRVDPDWLLYSDTRRMKSCHDDGEIFLCAGSESAGAMFAVNCGYLPSRAD
ncbi:hypothetical protein [Sphingopyxis sp. JAI128]|uniref:hypothetical protein n=1 Tax=Sphingopyxis sp. JAI128 TaxID=2723066 RepID=UPI001617A6F3|nr:hypothetical protein [Sphingopyxis sp. JAI128]MBB6424959.1 hypothetical protein [Sphingopyxis sp. JAI128]